MRQNSRDGRLPPPQDEVTVHLPRGARPPASARALPDDGVTVLVSGAMLAPAPTPQVVRAGEAPVFVDDSGGRKRMLRIAGVLIALLSIGFIGVVGVALAVPNVATSVGLGSVIPFMVPGAAALPPMALPTPIAAVVPAKPKAKPVIVVAATTDPEPVDVHSDPTTDPAPDTTVPVTTAPATGDPVTAAPVAPEPGGIQTGGTPAQGGAAPVDAPPADANVVGGNAAAPVDQAPPN